METQTGTEEEVLAVADEWAEAMVSNDADRIAWFLADEWVIVHEKGVSERETLLGLIRSGDLTHSRFAKKGDVRVRIYGETALFTGRLLNTAHFEGNTFEADEWTTDFFVRREGRWVGVLSHTTSVANEKAIEDQKL
jgi:ketosteroid isomerase-like protein